MAKKFGGQQLIECTSLVFVKFPVRHVNDVNARPSEQTADAERETPLAQGEGAKVEVIMRPHMTDAPISSFICPGCGSVYKLVRLKTPAEPNDHPVGCLTRAYLLKRRI
jgi:hypothetical protein